MNKLTPKQEAFAQKYVELSNASEAYRQAYDAENMNSTTITNEAYDLTVHPDVAPRIFKLREELAERNAVTLDSLSLELIEARDMAKDATDHREMRAGTMDMAKLHGIIIDRKELTGKGGKDLLNAVEITFVGVDDV